MTGQGSRQNRRPQVLLLGNGINRAFGGGSWGDLIRAISVNPNLPPDCELHLPMPLRAILVTGNTVGARLREAAPVLYGKMGDPGHAEMLRELVGMGFDHILTSNFSYELEMAVQPDGMVDDARLEQSARRADGAAGPETVCQLHTFRDLEWDGRCTRLWHIHGEGRLPDTMILGHYYYGNLLRRISEDLGGEDEGLPVRDGPPRSWPEVFLRGDVYTLGFGFDMSEVDLWWLLDRKRREPTETGSTCFFGPVETRRGDAVNEKEELLRVLGVEVCHCSFRRPQGGAFQRSGGFREFYRLAIDEIRARMAEKQRYS